MSSEPRHGWAISNPDALIAWAFSAATPIHEAVAVLEFVRDRILRDPDFGERIDEHTRGDVASGTTREVVWTFDPVRRYVEIIAPFSSNG
jgi:hypothetical protein